MTAPAGERPPGASGRYWGREQLRRSIQNGLASGRSFLLCGGPKLGRTATLRALVQAAEIAQRRNPGSTKAIPVLLDLAAIKTKTAEGLAAALYETIGAAVLTPHVFRAATPVRAPELKLTRGSEPWSRVGETLHQLWRALEGTPGWCRVRLFVDNGDALLTGVFGHDLAPLGRLLKGEMAWAPEAVVVTGGRSVRESLRDGRSPLGFLRPLFLSVLKESDATALVKTAHDTADERFVDAVLDESGKHPWMLRLLLVGHEQRRFQGTTEQAVAAVQAPLTALFQRIWQEIDLGRGVTYRGAYAAPEHALLQYLIDRGEAADVRTAEKELGLKALKEYAELLEYCGVVERTLAGNETRFRAPVGLFNRWYRTRVRR